MSLTFEQLRSFFHIYIQMLFLLAPFFSSSIFLMMSDGMEPPLRRKAAIRTSFGVLISICIFFFFGKPLFSVLGITLPAFQIGTGCVLFLSSIMRVLGIGVQQHHRNENEDFAVVPLAIPIIVGPGTIGALLVLGTAVEDIAEMMAAFAAVFCGGLTVAVFILLAERIERLLGQKLLATIIKVTALMLTALAAQIIFTGIKGFFSTEPAL
ncbi:MAG: MarC family protein [Anaerohalosphaeraceae bacterium]